MTEELRIIVAIIIFAIWIIALTRGCGQKLGLFRQLIQGFACTPLGSYTLVILLSSCHCTIV